MENGRPMRLYPAQRVMLADLFGGAAETLILIPKKNGKSTLLSALAIYHLLTTEDAECVIAAASRDQAAIMLRQARGFVRRSPALQALVAVKQREIVSLQDEGRIRVLASDADTADGVIPTLALVDELHRHKSADMYGVFRDGLGPRAGRMVTISTAGDDELSPLGIMRRAALNEPGLVRDGAYRYSRSVNGEFVMHEWALDDADDLDDMAVVKTANPAPWQTTQLLARRHDSPSTTPWQWARFAGGVWMKGETSAISPEEWDALGETGLEVVAGTPRLGWLDLGWKIDTTAMGVVCWEGAERRVIAGVNVIEPPVEEDAIVSGLLDLQVGYGITRVVYDPNAGGQQMAQLLERGEHPLQRERGLPPLEFIEHSQDNTAMALAAARFSEAARGLWIRHDGGPVLRAHVLNAVLRQLGGERFKFDRPSDARGDKRRHYPIDAFTGGLMGHSVLVAEMSEPPGSPMVEVFG